MFIPLTSNILKINFRKYLFNYPYCGNNNTNIIFAYFPAPNQSSAENKNNSGLTQPSGGSVNPNNIDPDNKGFYENLPFHGMQNPPNKVRT